MYELATIRRQPIIIPNMRKVEQSERRLAVSGDILRLSPGGHVYPQPALPASARVQHHGLHIKSDLGSTRPCLGLAMAGNHLPEFLGPAASSYDADVTRRPHNDAALGRAKS